MRKIVLFVSFFVFFTAVTLSPAYAGGGASLDGAKEWTQQANKVFLEAIRETGLEEVYQTSQIVTKQIQQYTTQLQELAQAVKGNLSMPFKVANDFKSAFSSLYSTVKGSGEALYSYANADNWMSDVTSSSGVMGSLEYSQKSNKAARKVMDDIITKEESEASLAEDLENASNCASGTTSAVQANTRAQIANLTATKNQTAAHISYYDYVYNRCLISDTARQQDYKEFQQELQKTSQYKW